MLRVLEMLLLGRRIDRLQLETAVAKRLAVRSNYKSIARSRAIIAARENAQEIARRNSDVVVLGCGRSCAQH